MTKHHPKKKKVHTPEKPEEKETPISETEDKDSPPPKPISEEASAAVEKLSDNLFWIRIALAVIGGTIATFLFEGILDFEEKRWTSIGFMIMVFIFSIFVWKGINGNKLKQLAAGAFPKKKLFTTGTGSFIFLYLFMWIVVYTLVNANTIGDSLPFT